MFVSIGKTLKLCIPVLEKLKTEANDTERPSSIIGDALRDKSLAKLMNCINALLMKTAGILKSTNNKFV